MAGRLAGHQDVLGPGRACGESERGGTRPRPEAGTQGRPGPMAEVTTQVKTLLDQGRKVCTAGEARPEHEAWTRRMQPPKEDSAPGRPWTGRGRPSPSPAPSPRPAEQSRRTRPSRTGTPGRRPSRWNDSNAKPRPARSRSSWTTPDPTTRKR